MTLPEPGKLADFDFDWKFENWSKNDPLIPQYVNLTPQKKNFFYAGDTKTFLLLGCSLDLVTTPHGEKSLHSYFLGALAPPKGGPGTMCYFAEFGLIIKSGYKKVDDMIFSYLSF